MGAIKLLGAQAACGVNVGAASTFEGAVNVRLVNSGTTVRLVTIANSADVTLGTCSLAGGETIILKKGNTDQIFAAHAEVLGAPVLTEGQWQLEKSYVPQEPAQEVDQRTKRTKNLGWYLKNGLSTKSTKSQEPRDWVRGVNMPYGKGTYGKTRGRPKKKGKRRGKKKK